MNLQRTKHKHCHFRNNILRRSNTKTVFILMITAAAIYKKQKEIIKYNVF